MLWAAEDLSTSFAAKVRSDFFLLLPEFIWITFHLQRSLGTLKIRALMPLMS